MDRFENARVFTAVIDAGSFTRAADGSACRAPRPANTCSSSRSASARACSTAPRGASASLPRDARSTNNAGAFSPNLDEAERTASALHNEPRGELRVIAPTNFGLTEIGTAITDFLVAYPKLRINLTQNDRITDPIEGGYDIAISVDLPRGTSTSLTVHKLNSSRRIFVPRRIIWRGAERRTRRRTSRRTIASVTATWCPTNGTSSARTASGW